MKNIFLIAIFFVSAFFVAFSVAAEENNNISSVVEAPNSCKLMGDNLYSCTPFECDSKTTEGVAIHNNIVGLNNSGECLSVQSNDKGEKVTCRYTEESRRFLALKMKKFHSDLVNIPEDEQMDESAMADIFHNECDVESPEMDDKPIVNEDEEAIMEDGEEGELSIDQNDQHVSESTEEDLSKVKENGDLLDSQE